MESVRSIGKFKYNSIESEDKTLEIFTEDFSKGTNYNKVLEIRILDNKEEVNFKCINIREYDDSLKFKYLYRAGSSRGTDITPTAKITDIDKTYSNKIIPAIKEGIEYINKDDLKEEQELLLSARAMESKYTKLLLENFLLSPYEMTDRSIMVGLQKNVYPKYDELKVLRGLEGVKKHLSYVHDKQEPYSKGNIAKYLKKAIDQYLPTVKRQNL